MAHWRHLATTGGVRPARRLAAVGLAALLLAGCGGGNGVADLEPRAALDRAREAAKAQQQVAVSGGIEQSGETVTLDLVIAQGGMASGRLTVGGMSLDLAAEGEDLLVGTDLFAAQGLTIPDGVQFVRIPKDQEGFAAVGSLVDLNAFVDEVLSPEGELTSEDGPEVAGVPTVAIVDSAGERSRLLIAAEDEPLPLRIEGADTGGPSIALDFATDRRVELPPAEATVPFADLAGQQPPPAPAPAPAPTP